MKENDNLKKKENGIRFIYRQFFANKKARITLFVIGVLWLAVIMQYTVNSFFRFEKNILDAFVNTNTEVSSFELEIAADYGTGSLGEEECKEILLYIADSIGLQVDEDITVNTNNKNSETFIQKNSKNAETLIKMISVEQENGTGNSTKNHYLLVRLKIYKNLDSILAYRSLLENVFQSLKVKNLQTTMQLTADYKGKLSMDEKNKITDNMINNLQGKAAYENRQEDLYTVYAYSGLLKEYITNMGTKININVAINYDETTDTTKVYLGTPYIHTAY